MRDVADRSESAADRDRPRAARNEAPERGVATRDAERDGREGDAADHQRRADPGDAREDRVEEVEEDEELRHERSLSRVRECWKCSLPATRWPSTDSTCQSTTYEPGASGGSVATSRSGAASASTVSGCGSPSSPSDQRGARELVLDAAVEAQHELRRRRLERRRPRRGSPRPAVRARRRVPPTPSTSERERETGERTTEDPATTEPRSHVRAPPRKAAAE